MNRNDPMVEQELRDIHDRFGILRPSDVVEAAANAASALHEFFEWDDSLAAQQHRLRQARDLIRIQVRFEPRVNRNHVVYVSLPSDRTEDDGGYRITTEVMDDDMRRAELLASALRELEHFRIKYRELAELAGVFLAARQAGAHVPPPPPPPSNDPPQLSA